MPRTAKKIQTKKMEAELGQIGLEIEPDDDVNTRLYLHCLFVTCKLFGESSVWFRSTKLLYDWSRSLLGWVIVCRLRI